MLYRPKLLKISLYLAIIIIMLLAIDVGNTSTTFGVFQGEKLVRTWRAETSTPKLQTSRQLQTANRKIGKVIVCSVVPAVNKKLKAECRKKLGIEPLFVTAENIQGIKVKVKNKKEVGADRVVDALAAYKLYGGPAIVVDFGTATTFDVVSAKGEYLGGAIAPGISLARDALYNQTAKLPRVEIKAPKSVIGKDTVSAMQSGLVYGYVALIEGMIKRLKSGSSRLTAHSSQPKVIATGGYAPLICKSTSLVDTIDQELTLKGLRIVARFED